MEFMEHDGIIEVYFRYAEEYFSRASVERYLNYFVRIISVITEASNISIENLDVIDRKEKELICKTFNSPAVLKQDTQLIYQMFCEQAQKNAGQTALIYKDCIISFEKMNKMVNVLAHKLKERGISRQDKVIVLGDRTIEFILAIVGVMKAGAAYIPVDPQWPEQRIGFVVKDSEAKIALIASENAKIPENIPGIDLYEKNVWDGDESEPEVVNDAEDLAYCIYTSGTTGDAKGVMIRHKSLVNYVRYFNEICNTRRCVVPLFTNCSFDLAGTAIYLSVFCGNALEIFDANENTDFAKLIADEKYDCLKMTPSHLKIAIEQAGSQKASPDKHIITGGEKLEADVVDRFYKRFGKVKLFNEYGPTETTIAVTCHLCGEEDRYSEIPIGKPIDHTQIYIMNGNKLCGVGIPGEICIAGECLARGYINRPELTLIKFVHNPLGEGRLYRTGDLGKWRADGRLNYIGRTDQQVKIRGFRIELSAVESVLRNIESIDDCVVVKKTADNQQELLVAYVVLNKPAAFSEIRKAAAEKLPGYMVPGAVVELDKIPLTANGKIDYRALPEAKTEIKKEYVAPVNALECELAELFAHVLKQEVIGTHDNFFECGGNSLNAAILLNLITEKLNADISLRTFFAHPTVAELADVIGERGDSEKPALPTAAADKKYCEMSSAQKRLYMMWQMEPQNTAYNMSGALKIEGEIQADRLKNAFRELINRHEIARTRFEMSDDIFRQIIEEQAEPDFEVYSDTEISEEDIYAELDRPFDLNAGPLMRMRLYRRKDGNLLLFAMHHIIGDSRSHYLLIKELCDLYNGKKPEPLTWQYRDYCEWMKKRDFSKQKKYWLDRFSAGIPVLDFPYDYSAANRGEGMADVVGTCVAEDTCRKMGLVMKEKNMTEYMLTLAAFMILLGRYSRQDEVILGSAAAGRTHSATTDILGMFVNTVVITGSPVPAGRVDHFLEDVKDTCLDVFENQEYPFEELIQNLGIQRDGRSNPLFDIMFVFQNNETFEAELDGVAAKAIDYTNKKAKFHITFTVFKEKNGLRLEMEYRSDLLKKENAELFVKHYLNILKNMLNNPCSRIEQIEETDDAEKNTVLVEFNRTDRVYPKESTIGQLFDEQADKFPEKAAVLQGQRSISYRELKRRSDVLAAVLQREGVTGDDAVVIFAEKSIEAVAAVLAVIKAGGAYVPIDGSMPEERIRFMIQDSNPKVILTYHTNIGLKDKKIIDLEKIL
ncbi:MAG: amino acid adenylation domain-containing protein, partial [Lachnospiraceae bacterium]|nr:amino acid adenylation domain-containing protein [Lachnospiraceae bacterium]